MGRTGARVSDRVGADKLVGLGGRRGEVLKAGRICAIGHGEGVFFLFGALGGGKGEVGWVVGLMVLRWMHVGLYLFFCTTLEGAGFGEGEVCSFLLFFFSGTGFQLCWEGSESVI